MLSDGVVVMWSNLIVALAVLVVLEFFFLGYLAFWVRSRTRELANLAHSLEFAALRDSALDQLAVSDE